LFAAGEVSSNLHGANRISGNALAETQVFGYRAGLFAAQYVDGMDMATTIQDKDIQQEISRLELFSGKPDPDSPRPVMLKKLLNKIMDDLVGTRRSYESLSEAKREIIRLAKRTQEIRTGNLQMAYNHEFCEALELANMAEMSRWVAESALLRMETRGHHIRTDYPETDPKWSRHTATQYAKPLGTLEVTRLQNKES